MSDTVEATIAKQCVTTTLVAKCRGKIVLNILREQGGGDVDEMMALLEPGPLRQFEEKWRSQLIPRLLQMVYTKIVQEELYDVVKKYKDPTINFKRLRTQCVRRTKEWATGLF